MDKNFDDFMKTLDSKDWSKVLESISKQTEGKDPKQALIHANFYTTTVLLREYHEWLNK
jgi:chemotaxis methyl-accepting protein methylase